MDLITCENVTVKYDRIIAVDHVSFAVGEHDFLCIFGENGSGKSTLMRAMVGLVPLSGGMIRYDGAEKNEIGYLPQQTAVQQDFPAAVDEVVLSGRLNSLGRKPFYGKADKQSAVRAMQMLDIEAFRKRSYRELSGGQQQRVLLARAMCASKKLLLLDEPATGLDPLVRNEFYELLHMINRVESMAVVVISHDVEGMLPHATKVLHMDTSVAFYGSTEDYLKCDAGIKMTQGGRS